MKHLGKFFNKYSYKLVWLVVISSILFNLGATSYELSTKANLIDHYFYGIFLSPFDSIRYGHFIARKLFLVVIALSVFIYWLKKQKNVLQNARKNLKYILAIGLTLFFSRILTYGFWFYNDDLRFFHWHLFCPSQPICNIQGMWGPVGSHPIAILNLVLPWFGTNYTLYNSLGLFFYFLAGVAIFALISKLQKSKFISLIAAIFFLTTPTYFQGRLLIGEVINSPFIVLLVVLSFYMLFQKFIPGALIFAAAALEYGVAKSYFIALPLTLFALFFANSNPTGKKFIDQKKSIIFFVVAICLISFVYMPIFDRAPGGHTQLSEIFALDQLFVFGDVLLAVTLPYGFSYPLVHLLSLTLNNWKYITIALGFIIVAVFAVASLISILSKKIFSAKMLIIGLSIILPTAAVASFMGVRVEHNVARLVEYHKNSLGPLGATGYGIFPALGLVFVLMGLAHLVSKRTFKVSAIILIFINIVTSFSFDYRWLMSPYSYPQRKYDEQLQKILPRDGINRYIFVPGSQRPLYEGVRTFGSVFQGDQGVYTFMGKEDFVQAIKEDKVRPDHIYFLITNGKPKYDIYDYSEKIRSTPYNRLIPLIESLTIELTPKNVEFW